MPADLLTRAAGPQTLTDQHDAHQIHPLLAVTWLDISALPLGPDDPTTTDEALANLLGDQLVSQYQGAVDDLQARHGADTVNPFDAAKEAQLRAGARGLAKGRLDQYETRLRNFLATNPSEDALADWLAHRASVDAAVWARLDSLGARREAQKDFYNANGSLKVGKWRVDPGDAKEYRCQAIAGVTFDTYEEAEAALDGASHFNCVHYLTPAD